MVYKTIRKQTRTAAHFLLSILILGSSRTIQAHGGDVGADERRAKKPPKEEHRRAPRSTPSVLSNDELGRLIQEARSIPQDVVVVSCVLSKAASCRGLMISLSDSDGHKLLASNSGISGVVGFEGLESTKKYVVKIESEKYVGTIEVQPGKTWALDGDRR